MEAGTAAVKLGSRMKKTVMSSSLESPRRARALRNAFHTALIMGRSMEMRGHAWSGRTVSGTQPLGPCVSHAVA